MMIRGGVLFVVRLKVLLAELRLLPQERALRLIRQALKPDTGGLFRHHGSPVVLLVVVLVVLHGENVAMATAS